MCISVYCNEPKNQSNITKRGTVERLPQTAEEGTDCTILGPVRVRQFSNAADLHERHER
jgi:hypothetical protein